LKTVTRKPRAMLAPFVRTLWASEAPAAAPGEPTREVMLPTGMTHVVFRLTDDPLRTFSDAGTREQTFRGAVVGGARAGVYVREIGGPVSAVGAMLEAGAASLLFGVPADELAGRHVELEDLWGGEVVSLRDRLGEAATLDARLDLLEAALAAHLPKLRALHPAVAHGLSRISAGAAVGDVVADTGYSHRHFVALFRSAVGFAPRTFTRLLRLQKVLAIFSARPKEPLAQVALEAGYSDQAHLTREFGELTTMTPGRYRQAAPANSHHVPIKSGSDLTACETRVSDSTPELRERRA
jgi:AraC-like DNA-binding protein